MSDAKEGLSIYGKFGWAFFLIIAGVALSLPSIFPEGFVLLTGGLIILTVSLIKKLKSIDVDVIDVLVGAALAINGANKVLHLDIGFLPALMVITGIAGLMNLVKK